MDELLLEPLKYYEQTAKKAHEDNLSNYYDELIVKSGIDQAENRKTAALYRKKAKIAEATKNKLSKLKGWRVFLILLAIFGIIAVFIGLFSLEGSSKLICSLVGLSVTVLSFLIVFLVLNKKIKNTEKTYLAQKAKADGVYQQAEAQMRPLNELFTEKDTFTFIEKVMPNLKFSDDYTLELSEDFRKNFGFIDDIDVTDRCSTPFQEE